MGESLAEKLLEGNLSDENGVYMTEEEKEEAISRILFKKEGITEEVMEAKLFPFEQSGYLTAEQKLDLLLYMKQRDRQTGMGYCLLNELGAEGKTVFTEQDVDRVYLMNRRKGMPLSWEEKQNFFVKRLLKRRGAGLVENLLRLGGDAILFGECAKESGQENSESRIKLKKGNMVYSFPFLNVSFEEEERVIRVIIQNEKQGELTQNAPIWQWERPDGIKITAIRPPVAEHWGMTIFLGGDGEGKCQSQ